MAFSNEPGATQIPSEPDDWGSSPRGNQPARFLAGFCGCAFLVIVAGGVLGGLAFYPHWANTMGKAAAARGQQAQAIEWYDRALDSRFTATTAFDSHYGRGVSRLRQNDVPGALADFEECVQLRPDAAGGYWGRGNCRQKRLDWKGALDDANHQVELSPTAASYTNRSHLRRRLTDVEGALADANAALGKDPSNRDARFARALALSEQGDGKGSIYDLNILIASAPNQHLYATRARERALRGEHEAALADIAEARKLAPQDLYVALWSFGLGGDASALENLPLTDKWVPQIVRFYRGELTHEQLLDEANKGETELVRQERRCEAWGYHGLLAERDGDRETAKADYEKCVATGVTNFIEYAWAARRLTTIRRDAKAKER